MILYGSLASPFVRKVRVVLFECGGADQVELRIVELAKAPEEFFQVAPVRKIPVLVLEGGKVLIESDLISRYLVQQWGVPQFFPEVWDSDFEQVVAMANALSDAAVDVIREERRPEEFVSPVIIDWHRQRVVRIIQALESQAKSLNAYPRYASIAVGCALGYVDFRRNEIDWRLFAPRLRQWWQEFGAAPSMVATQPR